MKDPIALSEDPDSDDEQAYCVGNIVTVRNPKRNAARPFWVGGISRLEKGFKNRIEACWFEILTEANIKSGEPESEESKCFKRDT